MNTFIGPLKAARPYKVTARKQKAVSTDTQDIVTGSRDQNKQKKTPPNSETYLKPSISGE